jgi:Ca2+-binding EF-hand superfamily protein
MIAVSKLRFELAYMVVALVISTQSNGQPPSQARSIPSKIGQVPITDVLQRLGATLERGSTSQELDSYTSHFDRMDTDRDGKHTKVEYVDKGGYMTPQARAGIFRAADGNADGVVTKAEYVLNRIITDEAKAIVQGMDDDKDGLVERVEFVTHVTTLLSDRVLAEQIYTALDANADGGIPIPEYLRIWGQWARAGRVSAEQRIAARKAELGELHQPRLNDPKTMRQRLQDGDVRQPPFRRAGANRSGRPTSIGPGQAGLGRLASSELEIGKPFPLVNLIDADGKAFSTEQFKGHTTVLVAGCLTCPAFLRSYQGIEAVHRDYASKGVRFYYVYRALAHPENNSIVKPFSLKERLMHVAEARIRLKTRIPWLADNMNNDFKRTAGNTNNSEFLLDPQGRIMHMQMWSDGERLRAALAEQVGPIEKQTAVADLGIPPFRMQPNTRGTVLPKIDMPGIMVPLQIEPKPNSQPFYVKLRAEAEASVLENGSGKIYLGFHIDPIHHTHWNNLADALHFELKASSNTQVSPGSGDGPKLDVESDSDPREFLVGVENAEPGAPLNLTVRYFACSDDPAWCKPVTQQYTIYLKRDEFGGATFGRTFMPGGPGRRPGGPPMGGFRGPPSQAGGPGFAGPPSAEMFFSRFDRNKDGKLAEAEVPVGLWQRLRSADANADGAITSEEFRTNRNR